MALGARHRSIVRLVLGEVGMLVSVGALAGALLASAAGRSVASLVFGVKPSDPVTLAAAIALIAAIALVASYLPARRAIRVAPVTALRAE
jgi:ABC-type antimicrobial peptide transport system permease subunit